MADNSISDYLRAADKFSKNCADMAMSRIPNTFQCDEKGAFRRVKCRFYKSDHAEYLQPIHRPMIVGLGGVGYG